MSKVSDQKENMYIASRFARGKLGDECIFCYEKANNIFFTMCNRHVDLLRKYKREDELKAINEMEQTYCDCGAEIHKEEAYYDDRTTCDDCCDHEIEDGHCLYCHKYAAELYDFEAMFEGDR